MSGVDTGEAEVRRLMRRRRLDLVEGPANVRLRQAGKPRLPQRQQARSVPPDSQHGRSPEQVP